MNWQSDFVSPHMMPNGANYATKAAGNPSPQTQASLSNNYMNQPMSNSNYSAQIRYSNPAGATMPPQFNLMPANQSYNQSYVSAPPHFVNSSTLTVNQQAAYSQSTSPILNRTNGVTVTKTANIYQMPGQHSNPASIQFNYNSNTNVVANNAGNVTMPTGYAAPPQYHYQTAKNLVTQILESLRQNRIKLIAFDFDCTIVNIHTGGQWCDSAEKLAEFVRPCFRELLPALLKCPEFFVCVVTYSPQEELIREVLRITMKDEYSV